MTTHDDPPTPAWPRGGSSPPPVRPDAPTLSSPREAFPARWEAPGEPVVAVPVSVLRYLAAATLWRPVRLDRPGDVFAEVVADLWRWLAVEDRDRADQLRRAVLRAGAHPAACVSAALLIADHPPTSEEDT